MHDVFDQIHEAAAVIADRTGEQQHDVAVVLGSGLGGYPARVDVETTVPYSSIPGFPVPAAVGHAGELHSLTMGTNRVLLLAGRAHAYEGHPMRVIAHPVRTAIAAGCRTVVLTNAAGGCGDGLVPGTLVAIDDHINITGLSPLAGENDDRLGPRFPDMTDVYTPRLRELAHGVAGEIHLGLSEGVYMWFRGPMFETPAEIHVARSLGASLVGMSTVPEAIAARHMGADVLGISLVTNLAAGMSGQRLSSEEVIDVGAASAERFAELFDHLLPRL
jgi:purine-nucleoside phosphorylase